MFHSSDLHPRPPMSSRAIPAHPNPRPFDHESNRYATKPPGGSGRVKHQRSMVNWGLWSRTRITGWHTITEHLDHLAITHTQRNDTVADAGNTVLDTPWNNQRSTYTEYKLIFFPLSE